MLLDPRWSEKPQVTEEPWRDVLRRAAALVEEHGLAKHVQLDSKGRMCLHGAISIAATGSPYSGDLVTYRADTAVRRYLEQQGMVFGNPGGTGSAQWNNEPERTQAEVVAALRAAAEMPE